MHCHNARYFLFRLFPRIKNFGSCLQFAGIDPYVGQLAALIHHHLEGQGSERFFIGAGTSYDLSCFWIVTFGCMHFKGIWKKLHDGVEQALYPLVFQGRPAQDRNNLKVNGQPPEGGKKRVCGNGLIGKIGLHDIIIMFCYSLDKLIPVSSGRFNHCVRDRSDIKCGPKGFIVPCDLLHSYKIYDPMKGIFHPARDL